MLYIIYMNPDGNYISVEYNANHELKNGYKDSTINPILVEFPLMNPTSELNSSNFEIQRNKNNHEDKTLKGKISNILFESKSKHSGADCQ